MDTPSGPTVQTPVELEATNLVPSPFVPTDAMKPPNSVSTDGMFETLGLAGTARLTVKLWRPPSRAA